MKMQRPRRTTEYETPSGAPRQPRTSRLQLPVRRPSIRDGSLTRCLSAEPINVPILGTQPHLTVPTSTKRQRSNSVTNIRTPQRTQSYTTPSKTSQFTGEKSRAAIINDKRWIQEQVTRITEYLKSVDCGMNTEFLHRDGLKTMSIKQFIGLVDYFLKFIGGNKFKIGSNYVESILNILSQIEYPYTVNKSWLKTPTAPHAFGNAIMLFSFLMEFIPPADNIKAFQKKYLVNNAEYPDLEFAFKLSNMAEQGFPLWNNQINDEFETLQKSALNLFIAKKLGNPGTAALDEEIATLNLELDVLLGKMAGIQDEEEYHRLDKEIKTNQRKIEKIQTQMIENAKTIDQLQLQILSQQELIYKHEICYKDAIETVNNQETSVRDRNKLIEEVTQLQYVLHTKEKACCDLTQQDNQTQIQLSRHIKQLTEKIAHFNSYIRQIMIDFMDLGVDVDSLCLHQNPELQENVRKVEDFLKNLQKTIASRIEDMSQSTDALEKQIKLIEYEINSWIEPKALELEQTKKQIQKEIDELDLEILKLMNFTTRRMHELRKKNQHADAVIANIEKLIKNNQQEIPKCQEENLAMMKLVGQRFDEFFTTKETALKQFQEALQRLQKNCSEATAVLF